MMKCNGCWCDLEQKSQAIATSCSHLFCLKCAQSVVESDSTCPICENVVTKSNIKLVNILQEPSACKMGLCGQTPETIFNAALAAVNFYLQQQQLTSGYREASLQKKIQKVQEACKAKLSEVHNGYQVAKRKYQEVLQQKTALEQDNQELQQKYAQKAMQARKLQQMFQKLQQENDVLRRNSGKSVNNSAGRHASLSPAGQMVTTMQQTQVFGNMADMSPPNTNFGLQNAQMQRGLPPQSMGRRMSMNPGQPSGGGNFLAGDLNTSPPQMDMNNRRKAGMFGMQQDQPAGGLRQLLGAGSGGRSSHHQFGNMGSPSGLVSF